MKKISPRDAWDYRARALCNAIEAELPRWRTIAAELFMSEVISPRYVFGIENVSDFVLAGTADLIGSLTSDERGINASGESVTIPSGHPVVVDWKTGARSGQSMSAFMSQTMPQLHLYSYLARSVFDFDCYPAVQIVRATYSGSGESCVAEVERSPPVLVSDETIERAMAILISKHIAGRAAADLFLAAPNPDSSSWKCTSCKWKASHCNSWSIGWAEERNEKLKIMEAGVGKE